jgi:hypothetical protein
MSLPIRYAHAFKLENTEFLISPVESEGCKRGMSLLYCGMATGMNIRKEDNVKWEHPPRDFQLDHITSQAHPRTSILPVSIFPASCPGFTQDLASRLLMMAL